MGIRNDPSCIKKKNHKLPIIIATPDYLNNALILARVTSANASHSTHANASRQISRILKFIVPNVRALVYTKIIWDLPPIAPQVLGVILRSACDHGILSSYHEHVRKNHTLKIC